MAPGDPLVRRQVGWRGQPTTAGDLLDWFGRADASVLASTHTGLPYAQVVTDGAPTCSCHRQPGRASSWLLTVSSLELSRGKAARSGTGQPERSGS